MQLRICLLYDLFMPYIRDYIMTLSETYLIRRNIFNSPLNIIQVKDILLILGEDSIYITAAKFLIDINAGHLAETSLSRVSINHIIFKELLANGRQVKPYLLLADLEIHRRDFKMAHHHAEEALELKKDDPRAWSTQGHLNFLQDKWKEAKDAYEKVLSLTKGKKTA